MDQAHYVRKNMSPPKQGLSVMHELRDRVRAIPDALLQLRRDERGRLGFVQPEAPRKPFLRKKAGLDGCIEMGALADNQVGNTWCSSSFASSRGSRCMAVNVERGCRR